MNEPNKTVHFFLIVFFAFLISLGACIQAEHKHSKLAPGVWRAVLNLENTNLEIPSMEKNTRFENDSNELPFNFEVIYDDPSTFHLLIHNGEERIKISDIQYGRDAATARDTVFINFPIYDAYIKAIFLENAMEGSWNVNYRENYSVPFLAYHGQSNRFDQVLQKNTYDLTGKWAVEFTIEDPENAYPAVADFQQNGDKLFGTFTTETGDYRFLEGTVDGNEFALSCFDGSHAFLFRGKIQNQDELLGTFLSGKHYKTIWSAKRNDKAKLTNPYELTKSTEQGAIDFSFKNTDGQIISLSDETYKNKIKLVKIMGTWCPNCKDESLFLKSYFKQNPSEQVEIISIAFERYRDETKALEILRNYKKKTQIDHELLYGGFYSKNESSQKLPMLTEIISYPTLLFIDRQNKIRKIHTGFAGPATEEYQNFAQEFDSILKELINE